MTDQNPLDPFSHFNEGEKKLHRIEPSWAKTALNLRTGVHFGHVTPGMRAESTLEFQAGELAARRKRFEAGDSLQVLFAIQICAEENLPLPTWLAAAFIERFTSLWRPDGPDSLDAVFNSPSMPLGLTKTMAKTRRDWQLGMRLWAAIDRVKNHHHSLDSALMAVLSEGSFGVGKGTARRLVLMIDKNQHDLTGGQSQAFSHIWPKS